MAGRFPDSLYGTPDFDRLIALKARTEAIARNLTEFLKKSDRFAKTIVFCVDQEHAEEMRRALNNCNADLAKQYPDYVARVVSDEGDIGRAHLGRFMELETKTPVILTTSQMLTTGVDAPTCKNVVLVRTINSMTEFKQIIGRGTRVRDDYGKLFFNIIDYTGSATRLFADPDFDGDPVLITEEEMDATGETVGEPTVVEEQEPVQVDEATSCQPAPASHSTTTRDRRGNFMWMAVWSRSPPMSSRTSMPTAGGSRPRNSRNTPPRAFAACIPPPPSCAPSGAHPTSAPRSSRPWRSAEYPSKNWPRRRSSRMLIHSTCCAMSPIVRRSAAGGRGQRPRGSTVRPSLTRSPTERGRC